jgi:hypothetical protein
MQTDRQFAKVVLAYFAVSAFGFVEPINTS